MLSLFQLQKAILTLLLTVFTGTMWGGSKRESHNILGCISKGNKNNNKKKAVLVISNIVAYSVGYCVQISVHVESYKGLHRKYSWGEMDKMSQGLKWLHCEERLRRWGSSIWREISGGIWLRLTKLNWWVNWKWNTMLMTSFLSTKGKIICWKCKRW